MNDARPQLSALVRCQAVTEDGRRLGHVHETRCESREGAPPAVAVLLVGRGGLLRRLGIRRGEARPVPWSAVVDWRPGTVVVEAGPGDEG